MKSKTKKIHRIWKPQIKWSFFGLLLGIILATVGSVAALNGWFGGGGSIPSDTLTRGLVGYWAMDEGTSTIAYDSSNYGHNATTSGTAPAWTKGKVGGALNFDGTDDLLDVRDSDALDITSAITIEAWVQDPPFGGGGRVTDPAKQVKDEHTKKLIRDQDMDPDYVGLAKDYGKRSESKSPYARTFVDNQSGKYIVEIQGLPMVDADGVPVNPQWEQVGKNFKEKSNLFNITVKPNGDTNIKVKNDQPDGRKANDQLDFQPQLFLDGVEQTAGDPTLLAVDPVNPDYQNNVLEWDFGIAKRRIRLIEGKFLGSWVFSANPNGEVRIKYNQTGQYKLKLGKFKLNDDEELVPADVFNNPQKYFLGFQGYPIEISDSATFNPDANPETTSVDGHVYQTGNDSWANLRNAAGAYSDPNVATGALSQVDSVAGSLWKDFGRSIFLFDTSSLDDNANISAATLSFTGSARNDPWTESVNIVSSAPASNTNLVNGDFAIAGFGSTLLSDTQTSYGSWITTGYNDFPLNATGRSAISLTGISKFGVRSNRDVSNSAPTWASANSGYVHARFADYGSVKPKLVVTYTIPAVVVNKTIVSKGYGAYALEMSNDGTSLLGYINYSTTTVAVSNPLSWHHFVMTYNGSEQILYIDGNRSAASSTSGSISTNSTNFKIGNNFSGPIDEVRVYNRALSPAEVRYRYNRGGPVAQWKFDEGEGRIAYDSAEASTTASLDGTLVLVGSATSSAWVSGKYGSALSFDGVNDYVDGPSISSNARTISFWLKRGDTSNKDVIDLGTPEIKISSNAITSTGLTSPTYYVDGIQGATSVANANQWYHITITDTADISASNVDIGKASTNYFLGLIDDVRIYNYARTPEEIRLDYNAGFAALFGPKSDCNRDPGSCMTQGLVGYWGMDEGSGAQAYDASNYAQHGALTSGPSWTKGKVGSALSFDGSDDQVATPEGSDSAFDLITAMTYEVWVNPTDGGDIYGRFISKTSVSPYSSRTTMLGKEADDETNVRWEHTGLTPTVLNSGANKVTVGAWNHVVGIYDSSASPKRVIYVNGVLVASDNPTGTITSSLGGLIWLGTLFTTNQNFLGNLDEVRIYNRALSAVEVRYHYNRGGPVAQWKFDEGEGRTAYDSAEASTTASLDGTLVLVGSATSSAWVAGKYGSAISFDGVNDYVNLGRGTFNGIVNNYTYEAWAKAVSFSGSGSVSGVTGVVLVGHGSRSLLFIDSTGKPGFHTFSSSANYAFTGNTTLNTGSWYHIAVVKSSDGGASIYVNGILDGNNSSAPFKDDMQPYAGDDASIGKSGWDGANAGNFFNGLIDDVRIYNYVRTPEEIRLDYNAGFAALFGPKSDCSRDPGSCMTQGLVGYWAMEEGSGGTVYDSSDYANNGSTTPGALSTWTKGKTGGALSFDGSDDYVNISGSITPLAATTIGTISAWVKPVDATPAGDIYIIMFGNSGSSVDISIRITTGGLLWVVVFDSDINPYWQLQTTNAVFSDNTWTHVALVQRGNSPVLYINGVEVAQSFFTGTGVGWFSDIAFDKASIGRFSSTVSSNYFNGAIDEVRIYNRAFSSAEVRYHYNRGGPVAQWKFDEGEGRMAYDSTDNNNDGTLVLAGSATSSAWVAGKYGSAISFDGVDDYVDGPDVSASARTVSFWLKRGDASNKDVIDLGTPEIKISSNAITSTGFTSPTYYVDGIQGATSVANANQWYYVAITDTANISASNVDIGKASTNYFNGFIDDVRIYNYVRTPEQILQDYNGGFSTRFK